MNVELIETGWLSTAAALLREGDTSGGYLRFPVPAFLIETETERILVDTGLHPGFVSDPEGRYGRPDLTGIWRSEQEQSVADQVDLDTLTMVVLTHLHFDHAGGLSLIPDSVPVVVQRAEWEAGHDAAAVARNFFLPQDYAGREVTLVEGDHDLLGDGSIELLLTPGHTPGHQSVRIGNLVLGIDVTHFASGLDDHVFPAFGHDREQQLASALRLRALRDAGATVLPGHDPDVLRPGPILAGSPGPA
jgi:glyoxylase-like metal-dependent hydrolase (beta-lactamase superfamily II)